MSRPNDRRTPDWMVERIALGELPEGELERARAKLLSEPDGAERLAAVERSNAEILGAHPAEKVTAEVKRRAHLAQTRRNAEGASASASRSRWLALGLATPLVAALAFFIVTGTPEGPNGGGPMLLEDTRVKGQTPKLEVHRREGGETVVLKEGALTQAGDLLQLGYQRAGRAYGVIVSFDGSGAVTQHLPESGERSAQLEGSGLTPLPHAYELDAAPRFERFVFVTSTEPFDVEVVLSAARAVAEDPRSARAEPLALPPGLEQTSFLLAKANR